jgi:hypothetical protein
MMKVVLMNHLNILIMIKLILIIHLLDLNNYKPNGWITYINHYNIKIIKTNLIQVFELPVTTDYSDIKLTESWLVQKWYDFGFLEEWGSFAFEGHVNGHVEVSTKDGSYNVEADETFESL